jgi:hypothetical protein
MMVVDASNGLGKQRGHADLDDLLGVYPGGQRNRVRRDHPGDAGTINLIDRVASEYAMGCTGDDLGCSA